MHESEDHKRRELIEVRNNADSLAYQTEKTLMELGDKVPGNERQNIHQRIEALRNEMKSDEVGQIKRAYDELQNAFYALSQQLYAQQHVDQPENVEPDAGQGQPDTTQQRGNGNGNYAGRNSDSEGEVIEGEYYPA
jgi:molecular chaperone DnaK